MNIGIDMGHTTSGLGTGAVGIVKETDKNREAGRRLMAMLREKKHSVTDCTVDYSSNDLADRVAKANAQNLDLFVSLHLNAFKNVTEEMGVETYIYNGSWSGKEANRAKAQAVQTALVQTVGWKDRRVKEGNFYVVRETKAPAILVELGFCDSQGDMNKWNTEKIAKALFKGITGTDYVGTITPPPTNSEITYRVVVGSYTDRNNANEMVAKLAKDGHSAFLEAYKKDGVNYLRVIAGSYTVRANADKVKAQLETKGYKVFIAAVQTGVSNPTPAPQPPAPTPQPPANNDDKIISEYAEKGYGIPRTTVRVRNAPSTNNTPVDTYSKGEKIASYDKVVKTNAYTWISYVSVSGVRRYVAAKDNKSGERFVDCY